MYFENFQNAFFSSVIIALFCAMIGSDFVILPAAAFLFVILSGVLAWFPRSAQLLNFLQPFGFDPVSVDIWTRLLGVCTLVDIGTRVHLIPHFYTDTGVMSRGEYHMMCDFFRRVSNMNGCDYDTTPNEWHFSLHFLSGEESFQYALFALNAILAIPLVLGHGTALSTFILMLLTDSMHQRHHFLHDKGQQTLRMLLLWSSVLQACGCHQKVDSSRWRVTSASIAYIGQLATLYWFSTCYKWHETTSNEWRDGVAAWSALHVKSFELPIGRFVRDSLPLWIPQYFLTYTTIFVQTGFIFFTVSPYFTRYSRLFSVIVYICFHVSLGLCMWLSIFPYCSALQFIPLFPPMTWNFLAQTKIGKLILGIFKYVDDVFLSCKARIEFCLQYKGVPALESIHSISDKDEKEKEKRQEHPTTQPLVRRLLPVLVLFLVYYWQLSHFKYSVKGYTSWVPIPEMPKPLRELCVAFGIRQNWQVFSNTQTPDMPCRVALVGEIGRPPGGGKIEGAPKFVAPHDPVFIDMLDWTRDHFPWYIQPSDATPDGQGKSVIFQSLNMDRNVLKPPPFRTYRDIILDAKEYEYEKYSSYMWKAYIDAARSNVFLLRGLGQYLCRKWNNRIERILNLDIDGRRYNLYIGANADTKSLAEKFCSSQYGDEASLTESKKISYQECADQLAPELERISASIRIRSFGFVDICPGELRDLTIGYCDKLLAKDYHAAFDVKKVIPLEKIPGLI